MNVSRKILVIIYIIFALLIPVVILAPQSILSSFSDLQEEEATDNIEKVKNIIKFHILDLVETNAVLSSREDS